ncbi:hypothetical protein JVX93_21530 [Mycolicibacterium boenickei]|nr:hypothetical protein JVX93_21530 [Mycolicibacterium boenickei]
MEEVVIAEEWMLAAYDTVVAAAGDDGITLKDSQSQLAELYQAAVAAGEVERPEDDLYAEGKSIFDRTVRPARQQRKTALHRDMEAISAALRNETVLGDADPALRLAYPLGTPDGRDKVLAYWTREDWRSAAMTRYRNAAEVTAAAQIFDEQATLIADRMLAMGVDTTGELFPASAAGAA